MIVSTNGYDDNDDLVVILNFVNILNV